MKKHRILLSVGLISALFLFAFGAVYAQEEEFDVRLVQDEPVYDAWRNNPLPRTLTLFFNNITWSGNKFVLSSVCAEESPRWGGGGLYVLNENGTFAGKRDICFDAGVTSFSNFQNIHAVWTGHVIYDIKPTLLNAGNGRVITGGGGPGMSYPALLYDVSASPQLAGRTYSLQTPPGEPPRTVTSASGAYPSAVVGDKYFAIVGRKVPHTFGSVLRTTEVGMFSLPDMELVNSFSVPSTVQSTTEPEFLPIAGVGNYLLVAIKGPNDSIFGGFNSRRHLAVYRVNGNDVEFVEDLGNIYIPDYAYAVDVLNPNRIVVAEPIASSEREINTRFRIYTVGSNGLALESTFDRRTREIYGFRRAFALRGSDLAYTVPTLFGETPTAQNKLVIERNGEPLNVEPLPFELDSSSTAPPANPKALAFSPNGKLMVATESGYVYLYQVKDADAPIAPQLPTFDFNQATVDVNDFLNSAQSYINSLLEIFGTQSQQTTDNLQLTTDSYTLNRPPETIAEIRQFQCAYNIVCQGSIETTGYGNLGPLTRAKIQEVFGEGSVQGASISLSSQRQSVLDVIRGTLDVTASVLMGFLEGR